MDENNKDIEDIKYVPAGISTIEWDGSTTFSRHTQIDSFVFDLSFNGTTPLDFYKYLCKNKGQYKKSLYQNEFFESVKNILIGFELNENKIYVSKNGMLLTEFVNLIDKYFEYKFEDAIFVHEGISGTNIISFIEGKF